MSKGSTQRPTDMQSYHDNYDRIFSKDSEEVNEMKEGLEVIPAHEGYYACLPVFDDSQKVIDFDHYEVIGWLVSYYYENGEGFPEQVKPILATIDVDYWRSYLTKAPSGYYCAGRKLLNFDEAVSYEQEKHDKEMENRNT